MMPPPGESKPIAQGADEYRRRGYDVEVEPKGPGLPDFLEGFQPDLIARRSGDSVVVEVKVGTRTSVAERLRDIAERVNRQPGWRLALVYVNPEQPDQATDAEPAPLPVLRERVQNAEALLRGGQREAAFLLLWSALEGVLRVLGVRALLPLSNLPPSTLFRELYSAGEIGREQFDTLMRLLPLRNQLVHGFGPRAEVEVEKLHRLTTSLLAEAA